MKRAAALLALLTALLYARVAWHPFIWFDDNRYVTENAQVQAGLTLAGVRWAFTALHAANWHPLTWLSHMLDVQLFGLWPGGHHLVNVLLHSANAALLLLVLTRLTGAPWRSLLVAALFAVHPAHVEAVAWVAERKELLAALFGLLALSMYPRRMWAVALFFAASLLSKPMWVTLPFLLLLLDQWPLRRGLRITDKLPLFALSVASCVMTVLAQDRGGAISTLPLWIRLENALVSYALYLGKTIWPWPLAIFYPHAAGALPVWQVLGALVLLAALTTGALLQRRERPWLALGWFWFLGTLVPVIGIVQVGAQAMADRYTYVPLIGLFIALAWSLPRLALAVPALAGLCIVTEVQLGYWSSHEALFRHALAVTPENALAHGVLSEGLWRTGKTGEALFHARESVRIDPSSARHWNNLAAVERSAGLLPDALEAVRRSVQEDGDYALAWKNLGELAMQLGRLDEAEVAFGQQARLQPDNGAAWNDLGIARQRMGETRGAIDAFSAAARAQPGSAPLWHNLGVMLLRAGRVADAEEALGRARQLDPSLTQPR